jgi:transcriptional regulator with XRE-family HTH domain
MGIHKFEEIDSKLLGNNLRDARTRAGLSPAQVVQKAETFADNVHVTVAEVEAFEAGKSRPTAGQLIAVGVACGAQVRDLLADPAPWISDADFFNDVDHEALNMSDFHVWIRWDLQRARRLADSLTQSKMTWSGRYYLTQALGVVMAECSERYWCAGWMDNTEENLPEVCREIMADTFANPNTPDSPIHSLTWNAVTREHAELLTYLADILGHWAVPDWDTKAVGAPHLHPYLRYVPECDRKSGKVKHGK